MSLPNDTGISKGIDNSKLGFIHRFIPASATGPKKNRNKLFVLLLLHGTGGNEDDLIPVASGGKGENHRPLKTRIYSPMENRKGPVDSIYL